VQKALDASLKDYQLQEEHARIEEDQLATTIELSKMETLHDAAGHSIDKDPKPSFKESKVGRAD
jgi:hypothetical protein